MTELEKELNRRADIIIRQEKRIAELENKLEQTEKDLADYQFNYPTIKELQKENAELKEKFLKVKADDVRKSKLDSFKTLEEKNEYLRQVANYAIFNEDISVMFWCFVQRGDIYTEQLTKAKEIIKNLLSAYTTYADSFDDKDNEIVDKAEQFIKDSEVEK